MKVNLFEITVTIFSLEIFWCVLSFYAVYITKKAITRINKKTVNIVWLRSIGFYSSNIALNNYFEIHFLFF